MDPERYKGLFVFVFTSVSMTLLWIWQTWARETGRWEHQALFFAVLAFVIWKYWNYRDLS